jgi:hypothetical protein
MSVAGCDSLHDVHSQVSADVLAAVVRLAASGHAPDPVEAQLSVDPSVVRAVFATVESWFAMWGMSDVERCVAVVAVRGCLSAAGPGTRFAAVADLLDDHFG